MGNIIFNGTAFRVPFDNEVRNFVEHPDTVTQFKSHGKIKKHKHIVWHENAGMFLRNLIRTCLKKAYGYTIDIDWDGTIIQHNDLSDLLWHGSQCNKTGNGVNIVNPYYPTYYRPDLKTSSEPRGLRRRLKARWWTHCFPGNREYVAPTTKQLEAARVLAPFLSKLTGVPYVFPTLNLGPKKRKITGWKKWPKGWSARPRSGHVAHRDYSNHADGRYVLESIAFHSENAVGNEYFDSNRPLRGEYPEPMDANKNTVCPHCGEEIVG